MSEQIVLAIMKIFGMFLIGWLARRRGYIDRGDLDRMSRLVVDILMPMLIFASILQHFEVSRIPELWPLPLIGFGQMAVGGLLGAVLRAGMQDRDPDARRTFHHFCAVNNFGFLPLIIAENLWGGEGLARVFFLNLGSNIGYWTIGIGLLGGDLRSAARNMFSPMLLTLLTSLGLAVAGGGAWVPGLIVDTAGLAGQAAVPLMLIVIGASLSAEGLRDHPRDMVYLTVVRLGLIPAVLLAILWHLPLAEDVRQLSAVVAIMPVAVSTVVITRRYGGSPDFAVRAALVTTVSALATVPLTLAWLLA